MCNFAIEIVRYYGSLYFARRCFLSSVSSSEKIEGYDVCGLHVYRNWTAKNLYIAKFGRAKRVPCESAGETPNGITYTSTHQRIVLAVGPIIFEVRSSGLIL